MVTMLVLYRKPDDEAAFEKRYIEGHLPLIRAYKNVQDVSFNKVTRVLAGEFPYTHAFRASWPDKDAYREDLSSDAAKAAFADADEFAKGRFDAVAFEQLA